MYVAVVTYGHAGKLKVSWEAVNYCEIPTSGSPCSFYSWTDAQMNLPDVNNSRCGGSVPAPRGSNPTPILTSTNRMTGLQQCRERVDCTTNTFGRSRHPNTNMFCQSAAWVLCTGHSSSGGPNYQQVQGVPQRSPTAAKTGEGHNALKTPWGNCEGSWGCQSTTYWWSAECSGAGKWERCIDMAHSHPYDKVWLWTAHTGFQRCSLLEIWVDTRKAALALP